MPDKKSQALSTAAEDQEEQQLPSDAGFADQRPPQSFKDKAIPFFQDHLLPKDKSHYIWLLGIVVAAIIVYNLINVLSLLVIFVLGVLAGYFLRPWVEGRREDVIAKAAEAAAEKVSTKKRSRKKGQQQEPADEQPKAKKGSATWWVMKKVGSGLGTGTLATFRFSRKMVEKAAENHQKNQAKKKAGSTTEAESKAEKPPVEPEMKDEPKSTPKKKTRSKKTAADADAA